MATIGFAGAVALASTIAMGGCFGIFAPGVSKDACERAADTVRECLGSSVIQEEPGAPEQQKCGGSIQCSAECINAADCGQIKDAFSGMPTATSQPFLDCLTRCVTAQ